MCTGPAVAVGPGTPGQETGPSTAPAKGSEASGDDQVIKDIHIRKGFLPVCPDLMNSVIDPLNHGFTDSQADFLIQWMVCSFIHLTNLDCGLL